MEIGAFRGKEVVLKKVGVLCVFIAWQGNKESLWHVHVNVCILIGEQYTDYPLQEYLLRLLFYGVVDTLLASTESFPVAIWSHTH